MSRVANIVSLLAVLIMGMPCNIFAIHFVYKQIIKKINRSLKDKVIAVLCICNICQEMAYSIELHSAIHYHQISDGACEVAAFMICFMTYNSIGYFVMLIAERYIRIVYPFKSESLLRKKSVIALCIAVPVLFGFSLAVLPLAGWGRYGRSRENSTYCGYDFKGERIASYLFTAVAVSFWLPLLLTISCFAHIVVELRRTTVSVARQYGKNSAISRDSVRSLQEQYISSMLAALIYIVSWCPYACVCVMFFYNKHVPLEVEYFSIYMSKSCTITSPIIFCLIEKRVRNYWTVTAVNFGAKTKRVLLHVESAAVEKVDL